MKETMRQAEKQTIMKRNKLKRKERVRQNTRSRIITQS